MTDQVLPPATNASTPQQELDALLAMVSNLAQLSLDMTRLCIDVQNVVPGIALSRRALEMTSACLDVKDQIRHSFAVVAEAAVAVAAATPPAPLFEWVRAVALTPDQLEASYGKGVCDNVAWQVVCIGREPGMYIDPDDAKANVEGVPNGFRKKKDTRLEALAFYRARYDDGKVEKWRAVPIAPKPAVPDVAPDDSSAALAATPAEADDDDDEATNLGWVQGE
ncbi:hypothetical protein C8R43DRAFT_1125401 [Mycena crocata]|nr:hypothetical protein C8R43DRAFT_1125401 [Mycena crocata]